MVMYHPVKFGCKKISSPADSVETVIICYMSPNCDPDLEDSKPIFLHGTLAHDETPPCQVWLQTVQQFRIYHSNEHSLKFWTFCVTLTLNTTQQSNLFTRQSGLQWYATKLSLVAKGSAVQQIQNRVHILITWNLTLKTANQYVPITLHFMMMHQHIKFGNKRFSSSKDIVRTTFTDTLRFCCDFDVEHSNPIFYRTLHLTMMYHQSPSLAAKGSAVNITESVIFWSYEPSLWTWPSR